ncbi:MAG TPA: discoidin domain-containing protein [Frankiaceae bacterium]|nr:discoidin domain-containing protein [Frankiaceae bacterium]
MARCQNCALETGREFCDDCTEYVAPPTAPATGAPPPPPVLPGPPEDRAPVRRPAEVERHPDDVRCLACGATSPPGRTFCRFCGLPLARVPAPPRPPREARRRVLLRRIREWRRPALAVLLAVAVLGLVVVAAPPAARGLASAARAAHRALTLRYEPVRPLTANGRAAAGHSPARVVDGITNTSWAAPGVAAPVLRVGFATAVDVDRLGVTQGAGEQPEAYARFARAHRLALTFDDGTTTTVTLRDAPGFQSVAVRARAVRWVRIKVVARFPGTVRGHGVALSEVEFFRLR